MKGYQVVTTDNYKFGDGDSFKLTVNNGKFTRINCPEFVKRKNIKLSDGK